MTVSNKTRGLLLALAKLIVEKPPDTSIQGMPRYGLKSGRIPTRLLEETDYEALTISDDEYRIYDETVASLSAEKELEHLAQPDIDDELWDFVCELFVRRDRFREEKAIKSALQLFLRRLERPWTEYDIVSKIENLELKSEIDIVGIHFEKFSRETAEQWSKGSQPNMARIVDEFSGAVVARVKIAAGSPQRAVERGQVRIDDGLNALRVSLVGSIMAKIWDEQLLFERGMITAAKKALDDEIAQIQWSRVRRPNQFEITPKTWDACRKLASDLSAKTSTSVTEPIRNQIIRTLHWIGASITTEHYDDKVVHLCTALETLLTVESDRRKGEAIALRSILVPTLLGEGFGETLLTLYRHYQLRSQIVHGSKIRIASRRQYDELLWETIIVLRNVMRLIDEVPGITRPSKLIESIESYELLSKASQWLDAWGGEVARTLSRYALERRDGTPKTPRTILKTHSCGELRLSHEGEIVSLAGWVHRRRDHGGLIFIDLRDHDGLVQTVFNPQENADAYAVADSCRGEYVLLAKGTVARRPKGTENASLPTGEIEVRVSEAQVLNAAKTPPFYITEETEVEELLRLKYRYLDLRRETMHENIVTRHRVVKFIRDFLSERGFTEIETPLLTAPTPEGARDYLVPSRVHAGHFYALPQSPQQFKQLLMVAGFERYFQIARCLRDEDLRADRQPEHTQLDLEMSFVSDEEDILRLTEELYYSLAQTLFPHRPVQEHPFPRMTYEESVRRFGSDKPDLRYGLELVDFSEALRDTEFAVFRQVLASGGLVRGLCVPGGAEFSRKQTDDLTTFVQQYGAKGLVSMAFLGEGSIESLAEEEIRSPVAKYFTVEQAKEMAHVAGAKRGDMLLLVADRPSVANRALDGLRRALADRLQLYDPNILAFVFLKDVPLFEWSERENRWVSMHHPFTSPREEDLPLIDSDPGRVRSRAYDLVCNGWELFSGSIRIHRRDLQEKVFAMLEISAEEARRKFGHMLEAFEYGAPPHAGIGAGIDRLLAVLTGQPDIREVIAFPKTKSASEPLTGAPTTVSPEQLRELHIAVTEIEPD